MLPHEIREPTCITDLKTVDQYFRAICREACQHLELLQNDYHWELAFREAAFTTTAEKVNDQFAIILTTCSLSNPNRLWEKFKKSINDDVLRQGRQVHLKLTIKFDQKLFNRALFRLEDKCLAMSNQSSVELGVNTPRKDEMDAMKE